MTEPASAPFPIPRLAAAGAQKPDFLNIDFDLSPFIVIWEVTQACSLACLHCRAEAQPLRNPGELTTQEGIALLDETRKFGRVLFVITGGDPLERPDIFELIRHGADIGLRMTMTPAGTEKMKPEVIGRMKDAGLVRLAVSLDGHNRESHDKFRGVDGSFQWTLDAIRAARAIDLEVQVNTTITRFNEDNVRDIADLLAAEDIALWSVFFLVPVGRGLQHHMVSPQKHEEIFHQLYDLTKEMPYDIKTTAAHHFRRVTMQRAALDIIHSDSGNGNRNPGNLSPFAAPGFNAGVGRASKGVNDGRGFVFISHLGDIMPSGFLPTSGGNVRTDSLVEVYRQSKMFRDLRDSDGFTGKCGYCDYNDVCGGSRARAFSMTGNFLATEPYCTYRPHRPGSDKPASNTYRGPHSETGNLTREQVMAALEKRR